MLRLSDCMKKAALLLALLLVLLAVLMAPLADASTSKPSPSEVEIMHQLRQALADSFPGWALEFDSWRLGNPAHPCRWQNVQCNEQGNVTAILLAFSSLWDEPVGEAGLPWRHHPAPLLPRLASMPWLESLQMNGPHFDLAGSIPSEWGLPGAFPRLKHLKVAWHSMPGRLPDIHPGALPALEDLELSFQQALATLPASWGASPAVLPALRRLNVACQLVGGLPPEWAHGFVQLQQLSLGVDMWLPPGTPSTSLPPQQQQPAPASAPAPSQSPSHPPLAASLPAEWASGFPQLTSLSLFVAGLSGSIPATWLLPASFPALTELVIAHTSLSGQLPEQLFTSHPGITALKLSENRFTGPLPGTWGESKVALLYLFSNQLTGPAFPQDWMLPGAMQQLVDFDVAGNTGLTGTLPEDLAWPKLEILRLDGTAVDGGIPSSWCTAPFASGLLSVLLRPHTGKATHPAHAMAAASSHGTLLRVKLPLGLGLGLGLAGCVAGGVVWRNSRRLRHQLSSQQASQAQHGFTLLQAHASDSMCWGSGSGNSASSSRSARGIPHQRQQQLAVLGASSDQPSSSSSSSDWLGTALRKERQGEFDPGGSDASQRRNRLSVLVNAAVNDLQGLDLLPMQPMPAAVAHRLQSLQGSRGRGSGQHYAVSGPSPGPGQNLMFDSGVYISPGPGPGSGNDINAELVGSPAGSPAVWTAAVGQGWQGSSAAAAVGGTEQEQEQERPLLPAAGAPASSAQAAAGADAERRQWGLGTQSLRLLPGELQFVRGADGRLTVVGQGSYGVVFLAALPGLEVAVKAFELLPNTDSGVIWKEAALLRQCEHARIVPLYGLALKGSLVLMAMKLMRGGSLHGVLQHNTRKHELCWGARGRQVALDVAEALDYLHSQLHVLHSDVKPSNVLLTEDWRAALADLGVAQVLASTAKPAAGGTHLFAAPEQLLGHRCTLAADMYSFGLLLSQLLTQRPCHKRGMWTLPTAPRDCPQAVVDLIEACLSPEPHQRPSAGQALQQLQSAAAAHDPLDPGVG